MHGMREMHGPRRVTMTGGHRDPAASSTAARGRRPWSVMVLLSVAQFMVILDATVVNVALPSIARSLGLAAGGLQWVVTAYVLASGGLVLLGAGPRTWRAGAGSSWPAWPCSRPRRWPAAWRRQRAR